MMLAPPGINDAEGRRRPATTGHAVRRLARSPWRAGAAAWAWARAGCHAEALALIEASGVHARETHLRALFALDMHRSFLAALGTRPAHAVLIAMRGVSRLAAGEPDAAIPDLAAAVKRHADFGLWLRAACALAQLDPNETHRLIGKREREAPAALLLAHLAERAGDVGRAERLLPACPAAERNLLAANIAVARGETPVPHRDGLPRQGGPTVSVVVAAYNAQDTIAAALGSLAAQSWRDIEIILVDDASTDATLARVPADPRIRVLPQPTNQGAYVARNAGLAAATGAFVAFHDADDVAHPDRIARQIAPLVEDDALAFTTARWVRRDATGRYRCRQIAPLIRLHVGSMLVRRRFLDAVGGFDPVRFGADNDLLLRLKVAAGPEAHRALAQPLTFGGHDPRSAVNDPQTGYGERLYSLPRLAYRETSVRRLIESLKKAVE